MGRGLGISLRKTRRRPRALEKMLASQSAERRALKSQWDTSSRLSEWLLPHKQKTSTGEDGRNEPREPLLGTLAAAASGGAVLQVLGMKQSPQPARLGRLERRPVHQKKVPGLILSQGTDLGGRFHPQLGTYGRQPIDVSFSLRCFSLPHSSLSKISKHTFR